MNGKHLVTRMVTVAFGLGIASFVAAIPIGLSAEAWPPSSILELVVHILVWTASGCALVVGFLVGWMFGEESL